MAYRGEDNALAGRQAEAAIDGAEQYAEVVLQQPQRDDARACSPTRDVPERRRAGVGDALFWFIGVPGPNDPVDSPTFGSGGRGLASSTSIPPARTMLLNLPGMTADLAQAIVDWRHTQGTASSGSSSIVIWTPSRARRSSPRPNSNSSTAAPTRACSTATTPTSTTSSTPRKATLGGLGQFNPGLLEYVTVFSREPNTLSRRHAQASTSPTSLAPPCRACSPRRSARARGGRSWARSAPARTRPQRAGILPRRAA